MRDYKDYGYLNMAEEGRAPKKVKKNSFASLILFWIIPFIVINTIIFFLVTSKPKFNVLVDEGKDYSTASVRIEVTSHFPIKDITASIASDDVEVNKIGKRAYTAEVHSNGSLCIEVTNVNGMSTTLYENISCVDDAPPKLVELDSDAGFISLEVTDEKSGVNFNSLKAFDSDGNEVKPNVLNEGENKISYYYDTPSLEVHISDHLGHEAIATFETKTIIE